jgi:hypothetical protein
MATPPVGVPVGGLADTTTVPAAPPIAAGRASTTTRESETGHGSESSTLSKNRSKAIETRIATT